MSGRRHRSNCELVAQGVANIASALFGGICVTGNIARTATNVRAGRARPGLGHAAFGVPAAVHADWPPRSPAYIPLAALAGVLAVVAWNMAEKNAFASLLRTSRGDAVVLLATFLLVVFRDLTEGILVGFGIGALLFLHRMAGAVAGRERCGRRWRTIRPTASAAMAASPMMSNWRPTPISSSTAFLAPSSSARRQASVSRSIASAKRPKAYVIDLSAVPMLDSTGAATIEAFARKAHRQGAAVYISGAARSIRRMLLIHGVRPPHVRFRKQLADAVKAAHRVAYAAAPAAGLLPS